ncbi:radical SAM/SPASM domain-containing protein [Pedobacter rhodius]|uniref:Radical SAM protein n=1 Tax=Pedobacter rhodius TaxID=3004098 RepID=A0ABT4KZ41_9SPHI|nr:radical SAM protein [Pedobacter sp. SJ11]MCZ4223996.1 radical SAM protein [Pedobacter sp. SJ11]
MKYSQFNSILPLEDKFVLYNTFSNHAIVLDPLLKDLLNAAKIEGIDNLEDVHPTFFSALKHKEFLLEDSVDEVQKVMDLRNAVDYAEDAYHLTINPTMNCNFKCWYCYETHIKASRMNEEIIERVNKFLSYQLEKNEKLQHFTLSWFGGEPLLYYYDIVLPIINHFNKVAQNRSISTFVNFTSNGFLVSEKMLESFKETGVRSLQITLDGYGADHDKVRYVTETRGSYEKIISNVVMMIKQQVFIRLRINYTTENLKNVHRIVYDLLDLTEADKEFIMVDFHRVWQDDVLDDSDIVQLQIDEFKKYGFAVSSNHSMDNVRNSCYADKKNSAVINYNGDVFKCTARDFTTFKRDGYIDEQGEIIWENGRHEKRMDSKFKNKPCLSCRLLPVCNGGCSQHAVENVEIQGEYCVFNHDENRKSEIVMEKVRELLDLA